MGRPSKKGKITMETRYCNIPSCGEPIPKISSTGKLMTAHNYSNRLVCGAICAGSRRRLNNAEQKLGVFKKDYFDVFNLKVDINLVRNDGVAI